jgi:hypothetical protein
MHGKRVKENMAGYVRSTFKVSGSLAAELTVRVGKLYYGFGTGTDSDGLAEVNLCCRSRASGDNSNCQ